MTRTQTHSVQHIVTGFHIKLYILQNVIALEYALIKVTEDLFLVHVLLISILKQNAGSISKKHPQISNGDNFFNDCRQWQNNIWKISSRLQLPP